MGIWNYISSTTDAVKRNSPDLNPVKDLCRTSYVYGNILGTKTVEMATNLWPSEGFRADAVEKMKGLLPDAEARSCINQFSTVFARNAAIYAVEETLKTVPFASAAYKVAKQSLIEAKKIKSREESSEANLGINIVEKKEANGSDGYFVDKRKEGSHFDLNPQHQKPEDVITVFMMKGFFMGQHMFDDIMVPVTRPRKEKSSWNP